MAERLDNINVKRGQIQFGVRSDQAIARDYADAFRDYGLWVDIVEPTEAAAQIRQRPIKDRLVGSLNTVVSLAAGAEERKWSMATAREADPELYAWLDRFVPAIRKRDARAIKEVLASIPPSALTPLNLALFGTILTLAGQPGEAVALLRDAQARHPDDFWINHQLAVFLMRLNPPQHGEAIRFYTVALALRPQNTGVHSNLAAALAAQGSIEEAIVVLREAIRLRPDTYFAYVNLGEALHRLDRDDEAIEVCTKGIALKPDLAPLHFNLGVALRGQGRFEEAKAALQRGHDLGLKHRDPGYQVDQMVRDAADVVRETERQIELDKQLPAVLRGERTVSAREKLEMADVCKCKKQYATMARFYSEALAAEPALADDLQAAHRYNAACAAALAATRNGKDAVEPEESARINWRKRALEWLRADLAQRTKSLDALPAAARASLVEMLKRWQGDPDLAGVRDPAAVAKLPTDERQAWRELWTNVKSVTQKFNERP
jgi:tetratricopeptide (TPR) repeat protein